MRLSEFWRLVEQEFGGPYGRSLASSHAIHELDDRTAAQAIDEGVPVRRVWNSLCDDLDVPEERRHVADAKAARRSRGVGLTVDEVTSPQDRNSAAEGSGIAS